ncbi:MAG TPA: hypothetical protein VHO43_18680 [Ignavibacteriales bacterium]|nr:hypothetical protein [Ignavibacteriales bacterium]
MKIKATILSVIFAAFCAGTLIAGAYIFEFSVKNDGENIKVEWKTTLESNLLYFAIERKAGNSTDFHEIARVYPKGSNSYYSYTDQSAYKPTDSFYSYRLAIYENGGTVNHIDPQGISHSVSGVKRTWGSIKAMFR